MRLTSSMLNDLHHRNTKYPEGNIFNSILANEDIESLEFIKKENSSKIIIDQSNINYVFDSLKKGNLKLYSFLKEFMLKNEKINPIECLARDYFLLHKEKENILELLITDGFKEKEEKNLKQRDSSFSSACRAYDFVFANLLLEKGFSTSVSENSVKPIYYLYKNTSENMTEKGIIDFNYPKEKKRVLDKLLESEPLPKTSETPLILLFKIYIRNKNFDMLINEILRIQNNKGFTFDISEKHLNIFSILTLGAKKEQIEKFDTLFPDVFVNIKNKPGFIDNLLNFDLPDIDYKLEYLKKKKLKITEHDLNNAFLSLHKSELDNKKIIRFLELLHDNFKCIKPEILFRITETLYSKERYNLLSNKNMDIEFFSLIKKTLGRKNINFSNSEGDNILHIICHNPSENMKATVDFLFNNGFKGFDSTNSKGQRPGDILKESPDLFNTVNYYSEKNIILRNIEKNNDNTKLNAKKRL